MKALAKIRNWGDDHHPKWLDFFRVILGIVLFWKGIAFMLNLNALTNYLIKSGIDDTFGISVSISLLTHLIITLHLIGGLCIAIGLRTRLFCLLNLPILIVAVFFVNMQKIVFKPYAELWLSVFVLLLLICFLIEGNGILFIWQGKEKVA